MQKLLIGIAFVLPAIAQSGYVVVGRQSPAGRITFQSYELFTVNGRDSVRILADPQSTIDERVYGRLPRLKLNQAGTLRREGALIVQIPAQDGKRAVVLPDQVRPESAKKLEELWAEVAFAGKLNRKDTDEVVFHPQEFFALIPGAGADAAVEFVLNTANFQGLNERLAAIVGVVSSFPKAAELERLQQHLENDLRDGLERFEGGGPYDALLETLKYAQTAEAAFPQARRIVETAGVLRERKAWVDAALVNLQSLYNAGQWDAFLEKYVPFEPYQVSFPKMIHNRKRAYRESARFHVQRGRDQAAGKNYAEAMKEFRTALKRDPFNRPLQDLIEELQRTRNEQPVELTDTLNKRKSEAKSELRRLYEEGKYGEALTVAAASVALDKDDPEFLYYSGLLAAVLRKNATAVEHLQAYLKASDSVAADPKRRALAYRMISVLKAPPPPTPLGTPNWFSGRNAAEGIFYCPESLSFQPRITVIRTAKEEQNFEWSPGGKLSAISSTRTPGSYFFDYFETAPQVARVGAGKAASDAKAVEIMLPSSPAVNTRILALLGRPAAIGFAPNPYFNPFVWTGLHTFRFSYDEFGRVESAAEIGASRVAKFAWSGERLQSISVYGANGDKEPVYRRTMSYSGGKLMSETVEHGGKQYKTTYKYVDDKLSEAEFEDTGAHDGIERRVRFL
jgi:tetratricopeptide (TPR) repeat protein